MGSSPSQPPGEEQADGDGRGPSCRDSHKANKQAKKSALWSSKGWKAVDISDEFLLGAEEGGFAGLEVLHDPLIISSGKDLYQTGPCIAELNKSKKPSSSVRAAWAASLLSCNRSNPELAGHHADGGLT